MGIFSERSLLEIEDTRSVLREESFRIGQSFRKHDAREQHIAHIAVFMFCNPVDIGGPMQRTSSLRMWSSHLKTVVWVLAPSFAGLRTR